MIESKILPAEEFIKQYNSHNHDCGCEWRNIVAMRKFAEAHVKAALEQAAENVGLSYKKSVLTAYPLDNIK
jgi:hypothetical protein